MMRMATTTHELPLFPLNTVLFPGMPLHLHIFEPRYKLMIRECLEESKPFGVVLIKQGHEVGDSATIYETGTRAHITNVRHLDNGEMDITSLGSTRFRVENTHNEKPYLTGIVHDFPLQDTLNPCIKPLARQISLMIQRYIKIFAVLGKMDMRMESLPKDPITLAFLTAVVLQMPMKDKQRVLDAAELSTMLKMERHLIYREAEILKNLITNGPRWRDDPGPFSMN